MATTRAVRSWRSLALAGCCLVAAGCTTHTDLFRARGGANVTLDAAQLQAFYTAQKAIYDQLVGLAESRGGIALDESERNRQFLRLGYTYVDRSCEEYFNALTHVQRDRRTATAEIALMGAAASGVMAAVQASAKAIALVAIGAGFTSATIETVTSGVLYELDASTTRMLTFKALQKYQKEAPNPDEIETFADAVFVLQGYGEICLPPTIEAMVKDAVRTANPEDLTASPAREAFANVIAQQRVDELARFLGVSRLARDQLVALYWVFDQSGASDPKVIADLLPTFAGHLQEFLFEKGEDGKYKVKATIDQGQIQALLDAVAAADPQPRKEAIATRAKYVAAVQKAQEEAQKPPAKAQTQLPAPSSPGHFSLQLQLPMDSEAVGQPNAADALRSTSRKKSGLLMRPLIGVR